MVRINNNYECAHEFFYGSAQTHYTFGTTCDFTLNPYLDTYKNNEVIGIFYSYYTTIGMLIDSNKDNSSYLLVSGNSMSNTTARHIKYLINAFPKSSDYIIYMPFQYGERLSLATLNKRMQDNLIYALNLSITKAENRDIIKTTFTNIKKAKEILNFEFNETSFSKLQDKYLECLNDDKIKEAKKQSSLKAAETRRANKQKKIQQEIFLNEIKNKYSYYDLINLCFNKHSNLYFTMSNENRQLIIKNLLDKNVNNYNQYSFIWFDGDTVKTSKGIIVNKKDVIVLLKLWQKNQLKRGMTIDRYTVLEVLLQHVKVGCHTIPTANIEALLDELNQNKLNNIA